MQAQAVERIIILAEYCHDFAERFSSMLGQIREHYPSCSILGVFSLCGRSAGACKEAGPFDEVRLFAIPLAAAELAKKLPCRQLFVFINHNPTVEDQSLYASMIGISPAPAALFRNAVSLARYLATGDDDHRRIREKLASLRSSRSVERIKVRLLAAVAGLVVAAGKLARTSGAVVDRPGRILFLRLDLLGDMTVTMPYLAAIKRQYPEAELTVMASSKGAVLLKEQEAVAPGALYDRLEVWDAPWHRTVPTALGLRDLKEMLIRLPALWRKNYDIIVQPVNFGTGILFALLCLGNRVAAPIDPRLPLSLALRQYVSDPVALPEDKISHLRDFLSLISARIGVAEGSVTRALSVKKETQQQMREFLALQGYDPTRKLILVNVGAGNRVRRWGSENFGRLMHKLSERLACSFVLAGGKDEQAAACEVERIAPRSVNAAGRLTLNELAALTSLADLVITADTALMHFAAALNRPLVAIFGAGLVDYCRPLNVDHVIVRNELGCSGCGDRCFEDQCPPPCLEAVKPESVYLAAVAMLTENDQVE